MPPLAAQAEFTALETPAEVAGYVRACLEAEPGPAAWSRLADLFRSRGAPQRRYRLPRLVDLLRAYS